MAEENTHCLEINCDGTDECECTCAECIHARVNSVFDIDEDDMSEDEMFL